MIYQIAGSVLVVAGILLGFVKYLQKRESNNTHECLNLLQVDESGMFWGLAGEAGVSFELAPSKDLRMCASGEIPTFIAGFSRLLTYLPARYAISLEAEVTEGTGLVWNESQNGCHPLLKEIMMEKVKRSGGSGRKVSYFAHLWSADANPLRLNMFPSLVPSKKKKKNARAALEENAGSVRELAGTISASLSSMGVSNRMLNYDEVIQRYWTVLNPQKSERLAPNLVKGYSLRSQLAFSNTQENETWHFLDGYYHKAITFYTYSDELHTGGVDALLESLPIGSRYIISVLSPDQEEFLDRLKLQRKRTVALASESKTKDYESQAKEVDLDTIITRARAQGEGIYVVSATIILRSVNPDQLLEWSKGLLFAIRQIFGGTNGHIEDTLHKQTFLSTLPLNAHLSPRRNLMLGSTASTLAPLSRGWQGTKRSGLILYSPTKEPVMMDLFDGN